MTRPKHLVTKEATCPNCGATVEYQDHRGIKRVRPKHKRCPECGEVWR